MEVHPILERGDSPKANLWYTLSPDGDGPSIRVGHTCTYQQAGQGGGNNTDMVLVVGGANPDGPFNDVYALDLGSFKWSHSKYPGLTARYEHSTFIPKSNPDNIVIFGGAQQSQNLNDVQVIESDKGSCSNVSETGPSPSPRTCHSMSSIGDKLYIFGGGHTGPDPVQDNKIHVYDAATKTWCQLEATGEIPCNRHGHIMVAIGTSIFIHGGISGTDVFDDLYKFNTEDNSWTKLQPTGDIPPSRTAHAATSIGNRLYMFGGMNGIGVALDDFYVFNIDSCRWTRIRSDGLPPNPRLDHAMCTVQLPKSQEEGTDSDRNDVIFVFGGMDTQGEIFNDCFVFLPS